MTDQTEQEKRELTADEKEAEKVLQDLKIDQNNDEPVYFNEDPDDDEDDDEDEDEPDEFLQIRKLKYESIKKSYILSTEKYSSYYLINTYKKALTPSDDLVKENGYHNPYIYSYTEFYPFSYCLQQTSWGFNFFKSHLTAYSPTTLTNEEYIRMPDLSKNGIIGTMEIDDKKGLVLTDPAITKRFQGMLRDLIKSVATVAIGKKISLKIKLFEPKSVLQRITDYWLFLPKFINPTYDSSMTPLERMKKIMTFAVSGLYIPTKQIKPFNPLICETFEGEYYNDPYKTKVYLEQISNYPTVSRFLCTNDKLTMHGYVDLCVKAERLGTKVLFKTSGYVNLDYKELNEKICYIVPSIRMLKVVSQEGRSAYWVDNLVFTDTKNKIKGIIKCGTNSEKIHEIKGWIFEYEYPEDYKMNYDEEQQFANDFNEEEGKYKILSKATGSWVKELLFDDVKYWDIDTDVPFWIRPVDHPIPSDCRFREDLIWLFRSYAAKDEKEIKMYENLAQSWKLILEKVQREERAIKKKFYSSGGWLSWLGLSGSK